MAELYDIDVVGHGLNKPDITGIELNPTADGSEIEIYSPAGEHWSEVLSEDTVWISSDEDPGSIYGHWEGNFVRTDRNVGQKRDLYIIENIEVLPLFLRLHYKASRTEYPYGQIRSTLKTYGTTYYSNSVGLSDALWYFTCDWLVNPYTEELWTIAEINAIEAGVSIGNTATWGRNACDWFCVEGVTLAIPTVTTQDVTEIHNIWAVGNGNITATNGAYADKRGICWKTSSGPTVTDSIGEDSGTFNTGAFTNYITPLLPETTYYVKAYAHNSKGYGYGEEVTFKAYSQEGGYIWVETTKFHFIDEIGTEQNLQTFDQDLNTTDSVEFSELLLTPKASSTGAEGTIFYDSDDIHVHGKID